MKFTNIEIIGPQIVELDCISDNRGFFARSFCANEFELNGLNGQIVQINTSFCEKKGTFRGLHYQIAPYGEVKFIRCISGEIIDVIVDMRLGSKTYLKSFSIVLSSKNRLAFYIPEGFAHAYMSLVDCSEVIYSTSQKYIPGAERGLRWDDPKLNLNLPFNPVLVSEKDLSHPFL
jgi:dTDP-4-dehydrorhamnose 3,5-epimerase